MIEQELKHSLASQCALYHDQDGRPVTPTHTLIAPHSMQVLCLDNTDKLVVHVPCHLTAEQHKRLVAMVKDWAGQDVRVLVMDGGMQLGVVYAPVVLTEADALADLEGRARPDNHDRSSFHGL